MFSELVQVSADGVRIQGDLVVPSAARAVVLFAHGSGSSRHSARNRRVAADLRTARLGTLLVDLLTEQEERRDARTGELRFDIALLARRLVGAVDWLDGHPETRGLPVVLVGAGTGAGAAWRPRGRRPHRVLTVVCRGGRPDLAGDALESVRAPVLLLVGGADHEVLRLNQEAARRLNAPHSLRVVPGATHLCEEPGALEAVIGATRTWCDERLRATATG
jgi:dienelactone hydrolase